LFIGDLEVENINGLNASDLVFINDPEACTIKSNVTFLNNVVVEGPLTIVGFLNGHPVDDVRKFIYLNFLKNFLQVLTIGFLLLDFGRRSEWTA
jgi:hypothetical protein